MQLITIHLYSPDIAARYVKALQGKVDPEWDWWQDDLPALLKQPMDEIAACRLSAGLALAMADDLPTFHYPGFGLTPWEAMFDRGIGMLMRPPARAFVDNEISPLLMGRMPIRLDLHGGMMGGAWIPPHLIDKLDQLIDARLEIWAKRIQDAETDPYPLLATMRIVTDKAKSTGLGLMEAISVLPPDMPVIQTPNRKQMDPEFRARIDAALAEEKSSLFDKLFRREP